MTGSAEDFGVGVDGFSYELPYVLDLAYEWALGGVATDYLEGKFAIDLLIAQDRPDEIGQLFSRCRIAAVGNSVNRLLRQIEPVLNLNPDDCEVDSFRLGPNLNYERVFVAVGDGSEGVRTVLGPRLLSCITVDTAEHLGSLNPPRRVDDRFEDRLPPLKTVRLDRELRHWEALNEAIGSLPFVVLDDGPVRVIEGGIEVAEDVSRYQRYGSVVRDHGRAGDQFVKIGDLLAGVSLYPDGPSMVSFEKPDGDTKLLKAMTSPLKFPLCAGDLGVHHRSTLIY